MAEYIMLLSTSILFILFLFLFFELIVIIFSFFKKAESKKFEPEISIVIPCYNEEKNIESCLEKIYGSRYDKKKIEVIVVDDGSKDSTLKVLLNIKRKHKELIIIRAKHSGKSECLNKGAKKAKHEYILTIDADTIIREEALEKIVRPLANKEVGATNGSSLVRNKESILGVFQELEYNLNNLIRKSFSDLFKNGIWFFGAFACYKKSVLKKVGYFKKKTSAEDMDIALEIYKSGYRIINVWDALVFTYVPETIIGLVKQRTRWWHGVLDSLFQNRTLLATKKNISVSFLYFNQYWWTFYSILSFPIIIYQFLYWLPKSDLFMYTFRWFSLLGPIYVIYKIPVWGISIYSIFGVLAGIISALTLIIATLIFSKITLKSLLGLFFYFPYTILLNLIILLSIFTGILSRRKFFIN